MRAIRLDQDGISPVMATILLTAIVVVMSTSTYVLVNVYREGLNEPAPVIAVTTRDGGGYRMDSFDMKIVTSSPPQPVHNYLFILTTPQNGTLVTSPQGGPLGDTRDFYFQLGASAGHGLHNDNGTVVGLDGLGGFHIRVSDIDGDGLFGGGDTIDVWYDGDGDQGHQDDRDDDFPTGPYGFDIKHRPSEAFVAMETRYY